MKFSEIIIKIPIYEYTVQIALTDDMDEYIEDKGFGFQDDPRAIVFNCMNIQDCDYAFIVIFHIDRIFQGLIVHESFHLTSELLRHIGTILVPETEESYAYLQEWLYGNIRSNLIKLRKELRNGNPDTREEVSKTVTRSGEMEESKGLIS